MTIAVLAAATAYLLGVRRLRARDGRRWSRRRTAAFLLGTAALLMALSPPLDALAHHDPRGHMTQHLLIGMYAPLGLVLGRPLTLLLATLPTRAGRGITAVLRSPALHVLGHPFSAALLSTGSLFVLYLTPLYAVTAESSVLHHLLHLHFLLTGYLFSWSVAGPDPAPRRPGVPVRVTALILSAAAHAYLAKALYAGAGNLSEAGHDQAAVQQAAQWMYYGGDVAEVLLATVVFAWWYRHRSVAARHGPTAHSQSGLVRTVGSSAPNGRFDRRSVMPLMPVQDRGESSPKRPVNARCPRWRSDTTSPRTATDIVGEPCS